MTVLLIVSNLLGIIIFPYLLAMIIVPNLLQLLFISLAVQIPVGHGPIFSLFSPGPVSQLTDQ